MRRSIKDISPTDRRNYPRFYQKLVVTASPAHRSGYVTLALDWWVQDPDLNLKPNEYTSKRYLKSMSKFTALLWAVKQITKTKQKNKLRKYWLIIGIWFTNLVAFYGRGNQSAQFFVEDYLSAFPLTIKLLRSPPSVIWYLAIHFNIWSKARSNHQRKHPFVCCKGGVFMTFSLTLSQTKNVRLFQTEIVCRRQFWIWWKWQKVLQMGRKHCGKKRNCLLQAISPFPTVFSKDLYWRHVKTRVCLGKG